MSGQTDESKSAKTDVNEPDTERELSDDELNAVAGGATSTLLATKSRLAVGLLLPAVQKIGDGSV